MGHQADFSKASSSSEVISRTAALLVSCMGGFVLAGWSLHIQIFVRFLPVFRKTSTVLGIVVIASGIVLRLLYTNFTTRTIGTVRRVFTSSEARSIRLGAVGKILVCSLLLAGLCDQNLASTPRNDQKSDAPLKRLSLEQLGNIETTTASKEPVAAARTPAAIYVITQEDIQRSGTTSIPEVLRLVPGVEVARIDSSKWSIGVRGFGSRLSRSVLVLIDGRTVYTPLFAGVYWEVQDTLLEDIERIEVIRGPGGTIWGANAVNAVINIITKSAKDTHGILASSGGGNIDQGFAGFRFGGGRGKDFNYRVYAKAFTRGPEFHPVGTQFDDWRMAQTGFRTDWDLHTRDTLTLQGDLYNSENGERVGIATYSPPSMVNVEQNAEVSGGNLVAS